MQYSFEFRQLILSYVYEVNYNPKQLSYMAQIKCITTTPYQVGLFGCLDKWRCIIEKHVYLKHDAVIAD